MFGTRSRQLLASLGFSLLLSTSGVLSAPAAGQGDPCIKIAGRDYAPPADVRACYRSFPFNETLRQNAMDVVTRVFDFFTFEDYYLDPTYQFADSTVNIRDELDRIRNTRYATDYDFNRDLYDFVNGLNDGHTLWSPTCYTLYQNLLPAPIVSLADEDDNVGIYIAPDSVELMSTLGSNYTSYYDNLKLDWKRLAGAKVLSIQGMDPFLYVDMVAGTETGTYLDHGIRVNSVFSSYRLTNTSWSQRVGDLAGPGFPDLDTLSFELMVPGSDQAEMVTLPYLSSYGGKPFTDGATYWTMNCLASANTNGRDLTTEKKTGDDDEDAPPRTPKYARASIYDRSQANAIELPKQYQPSLPGAMDNAGVIKSFVLPDKKTGVLYVGSFEGNFKQFQRDIVAAFDTFKQNSVSRLLIDLTNNGGGYVCLGLFLHQYLAGAKYGYTGFQSTMRANPLAQKLVEANVRLGLEDTNYSPTNWAYLNDTAMPKTDNFMQPTLPLTISGHSDPTSQRFHDICTPYNVTIPDEPIIPIENVAIVSNGGCASTCALFSTVMHERHNTTIGVFGGNPNMPIEYKGMAGNQVLEWSDFDSEIKTAKLKDDPLSPPDLLVNANFRHNWRTAWSYLDEQQPIAFYFEKPTYRFAYTKDTYNNPQKMWISAALKVFS